MLKVIKYLAPAPPNLGAYQLSNLRVSRLLSMSLLSLGLAACNLFHSPAPARTDYMTLTQGGSCSIDVRQTLKSFVAGNANPTDVGTSLNCIIHEIDQFKSKTRSATSNEVYSFDEISAFFGKYFSSVEEFGPSSLKAYFKFKHFAFGGGDQKLSKAELTLIENFLKESIPILSEIAPYVSTFKMENPLNLENPHDADTLNKAIASLHKLTTLINKHIPGQSGAVFKFSDLDTLDFLKPSAALNLSESETMQIVMKLKALLVNPPAEGIDGQDFKHFMTQVGYIVETGLRLKYTRALPQEGDEVFLTNIETIRDALNKLVSNSLSFQTTKSIPYNEIVQFIKTLGTYKLIPYDLRESSVENFLPTLISRVMAKDPALHAAAPADLNFKQEHLDIALEAVNEWIAVQRSFLSALSNRNEISAGELIEKYHQNLRSINDPKIQIAMNQMKDILDHGMFLRWKDKDKINLAPRSLDQKFSRYDLIFLSTSFSTIRAIMRGFLNSPDRRHNVSSMTEPELTDLYFNVREMGKDLKFIDTRNRSAPGRAFLEMNIFTSVSNGNDYVEFHEAMEWFYQVWSAGNMGTKIYQQVPDKCKTKELDVFDRQKLDHNCYTNFFKSHVTTFFDHFPSVNFYLKDILANPNNPKIHSNNPPKNGQSGDAWTEFDVALENAFRATAYSQDDFDSPDTEAMALILAYTESIFVNHSHSHTDELDTTDIWDTYPIMRGFIEKASNGAAKSEFIKKGAYSYLINYGEMPNVDHIAGMIKFGIWAVVSRFQKETAHVPDMVKVISTFSIAGKNKKIKDIEAFYTKNKDSLESLIQKKDAKTMSDLKILFYCSDDSIKDFTEKMSAAAGQIFSSSNAEGFHKNTEKLIKSDAKLRLECLPFE